MATRYILVDDTGHIVSMTDREPATIPSGLQLQAVTWDSATQEWSHAERRFVARTLSPALQEQQSIFDKVDAALASNQAYLAVGSPSNAQNLAQLRFLTRQMNGLLRLTQDKYLVPNSDT